ncbi:MAG: recombinase family protein [Polyangiales bacterium]
MLAGLTVALYARFSSANQKDTSIDDQVRLCREFVTKHSGTVKDTHVLTDYSISAASIARGGFEQLLRQIESRAIEVVVTESLDRLSRDLGDADRLWKLCAYHSVRLICISDGIDSSKDGSRMHFRMKAIMSDEFLVDLGHKTKRGLEGAALRGYCTGGLPYGYTSRAVVDPSQREPLGFEILIDEVKAAVVKRIFNAYVDGRSFLAIATDLNSDNVAPPRATARRKSRGWCDTTIREMLSNPAYVGRWSYGKKQWRKVPGSGKRRWRPEADEKIKRLDRPHLRIIDEELWTAVQTRRAAIAAKYAPKAAGAANDAVGVPGRRTSYPFSGILHCGACGSVMQQIGGSSVRYYRCADAHKRGTCANRASIQEPIVAAVLFEEIRSALISIGGEHYARARLAEQSEEGSRARESQRRRSEGNVARLEGEIARLVRFITSTDDEATLASVRTAMGEKQRDLERSRREAAEASAPSVSVSIPQPEDVLRTVFDLEERLRGNATAAREVLRQSFERGRVDLHPEPDGAYRIEAVIFPLVAAHRLVRRVERRKPRPTESDEASYTSLSCAGALRGLCTGISLQFVRSFAA